MTSKASPATGTRPTTPSTATLAEHPRRDVPGRAERARLAHHPQRNRRRDDVADHRDQADQPVDAVAELGARHDKGDIQQFRQRIEPRQPLLARQVAERIGAGMGEIELKSLELRTQARLGDFAPFLVDDRATARRTPALRTARSANASGVNDIVVCHGHHMVTPNARRKLRQIIAFDVDALDSDRAFFTGTPPRIKSEGVLRLKTPYLPRAARPPAFTG